MNVVAVARDFILQANTSDALEVSLYNITNNVRVSDFQVLIDIKILKIDYSAK